MLTCGSVSRRKLGTEEAISEKALLIAMMSQKDLGIAKTLFQACAENDSKDCETLPI